MPDTDGIDVLYGQAIQTTLEPYWAWAKETGANVEFTKHTDNDLATYSIRLAVTAQFDSDDSAALFKLTFSDLPKKSLKFNDNTPYFG